MRVRGAVPYRAYRWENWQDEVGRMGWNRGILFAPPLFAEAESLAARHRGEVPLEWGLFSEDFPRQLGLLPE